MAIYNVSGNFKLGSQWKSFTREVEAEHEEHAKTQILVTYGSKHKLPKRFINIASVAEVAKHSVVLEPHGKAEDKKESREETD